MRPIPTFLLLLVTLGPVPVLWHLGTRALRTVEDRAIGVRAREAETALLDWLRPGPDAAGSEASFPLRDPAAVAVALSPSGEFLAADAVVRSRACRERDDPVGAIESLEPLLHDDDPRLAIAARLLAADLLAAAGHEDEAGRLHRDLLEMDELESTTVAFRRWVLLRATRRGDDRDSHLGDAVAAWCAEVEGRATDVEELVLLRDLAALLPDRPASTARLTSRARWPTWSAAVRDHLALLSWTRSALLHTGDGWFHVDAGLECVRRVEEPGAWLARWRGPDGATATLAGAPLPARRTVHVVTGPVTGDAFLADPAGAAVVIDIGDVDLFGGSNPRLLLGAGLSIHAVLAALLVLGIRRQAQRAEALVAARGDLIARVTHELRTPITVLRMYGESLHAGRVSDARRAHYLQTILDEAKRLGDLVDRVALAARDDHADHADAVEPGESRVRDVVGPIVDRAREVAAARAGRVAIDARVGAGASVGLAPDALRCIVDVLVDNALRYGGATPDVRVAIGGDETTVSIRVEDKGPGVAVAERDVIFERWTRGAVGRRTTSRGAGMGLAIARKTARAAGGDVVCVGREDGGPGAAFEVRLPRVPARAEDRA